jgi:hypothetical protein
VDIVPYSPNESGVTPAEAVEMKHQPHLNAPKYSRKPHLLNQRISDRRFDHESMANLTISIAARALTIVFTCALLAGVSQPVEMHATYVIVGYDQVNCNTDDNLNELAGRFIEKCRKASIRRVFPSQHLGKTLREIKNGSTSSYKTAWKLLNDNRFRK